MTVVKLQLCCGVLAYAKVNQFQHLQHSLLIYITDWSLFNSYTLSPYKFP